MHIWFIYTAHFNFGTLISLWRRRVTISVMLRSGLYVDTIGLLFLLFLSDAIRYSSRDAIGIFFSAYLHLQTQFRNIAFGRGAQFVQNSGNRDAIRLFGEVIRFHRIAHTTFSRCRGMVFGTRSSVVIRGQS